MRQEDNEEGQADAAKALQNLADSGDNYYIVIEKASGNEPLIQLRRQSKEEGQANAAEALTNGFDMLMEAYDNKKNTDVLQAFN